MAAHNASSPSFVMNRVNALVEILERELDALLMLATHMELQLAALGDEHEDAFEAHQQEADAALRQLEDLHPVRKQAVSALGSLLGTDGRDVPVEAVAGVLEEYPDCKEAAHELQVLSERVSRHTANVREQCDMVDSYLRAAHALQAAMDEAIESTSSGKHVEYPVVTA